MPYKVQRWSTQPQWADFAGGDFLILAAVRDDTDTTSDTPDLPDTSDTPVTPDAELHAFTIPTTNHGGSGGDWYQLQDTATYDEWCFTGSGECLVPAGEYQLTNFGVDSESEHFRSTFHIPGDGDHGHSGGSHTSGEVARNNDQRFKYKEDDQWTLPTEDVSDNNLTDYLHGTKPEFALGPDDWFHADNVARRANLELDASEDGEDDGPGSNDGGSVGDGNFRVSCNWSHFNYDDPILYPGEVDAAHLHMFFGNTKTNAHTFYDAERLDDPNNIISSGGGSCNGGMLNRSAYWTPALMDGNDAIVPKEIIIYYKNKTVCFDESDDDDGIPGCDDSGVQHSTDEVVTMPRGLELIAGNVPDDVELEERRGVNLNAQIGRHNDEVSQHLFWSCGSSGSIENKFNRIPTKAECGNGFLNATIYFPSCWDGIDLSPDDPRRWDHIRQVEVDEACPTDFPERLPTLGFLLYWDMQGVTSTANWRLSSDPETFNFTDSSGRRFAPPAEGSVHNRYPGGSLHADWMAGWHDLTMKKWIDECLKGEGRNCTFGQTSTERKLISRPQNYVGHVSDDNGYGEGNGRGSYRVHAPDGSSRH